MTEVLARALLLGERLDTRGIEQEGPLASAPTVISSGMTGHVVLFRYGVVVFFGMNPAEEAIFVDTLAPRIVEPLSGPERDFLRILVAPEAEEQIDTAGNLMLRELKVEHMQLIAEAMAKSLILAHFEAAIAGAFDSVEPLAAALKRQGRAAVPGDRLLRHLGDVLLAQHRMVGRVAVGERPDVLWDHPRLERLHARLADWYELIERDRAIDRKLELVSRTAETLNDLLAHKRSLRVEWYIVALILFEIVLTLYEMGWGRH